MSDKEELTPLQAAVAAEFAKGAIYFEMAKGDFDPMTSPPLWEIDEDFINPFAEVEEVSAWAMMGSRKALPKQGVITFSAKQKKGKSLSVYALSLALLSGQQFDTFKAVEEPRLIMIFDLEMSKNTLVKRIRSISKSLGIKGNKFIVCSLKSKKSIEEQRATIEQKIALYNPDIVVIDQVAKLVIDINSTTESEDISRWIDKMSIDRSIWAVIHENKADSNLRGHLGTSLSFANVEAYSVSKDKGVFTISYKEGRETGSDGAAAVRFALDEDGNIITATDILEEQRNKQRDSLRLKMAFHFGEDTALLYSELRKRIMDNDNIGQRSAEDKIAEAIKVGAIEKVGDGRKAPYRIVEVENDFSEIPYDDDEEL